MPAVTQPLRVLFVDDDQQFLETIKELMTAYSGGQWEISTADNASKAFAVLQDHPVDLVVIDMQMGVMDGVQMLSLLNRRYPNVRKVALTGLANEKYRAACLSNGAELFLEKPTGQTGWENLFTALNELAKFKSAEAFRGVLRRVGLTDVIQMVCLAQSSSVLEISDTQTQGRVFVEGGQIIHAQVDDLTGEDAFNRLLSLSDGQSNLKPFVEPPARTISGSWEYLLMEAARKRGEAGEASEAAPAGAATGPAPLAPPDLDPEIAAAGFYAVEATSPTPVTTTVSRPKVEEFLVCSTQGEVLHEWQCRHADVWVSFFEFVSQRAQRLAQALPLGDFDRLEIQSGDSRAVVIISVDRGVLVRTRKESVPG